MVVTCKNSTALIWADFWDRERLFSSKQNEKKLYFPSYWAIACHGARIPFPEQAGLTSRMTTGAWVALTTYIIWCTATTTDFRYDGRDESMRQFDDAVLTTLGYASFVVCRNTVIPTVSNDNRQTMSWEDTPSIISFFKKNLMTFLELLSHHWALQTDIQSYSETPVPHSVCASNTSIW